MLVTVYNTRPLQHALGLGAATAQQARRLYACMQLKLMTV